MGQDIVGRFEIQTAITGREVGDLPDDPFGRLHPVCHSFVVEAAERAVALLSPPAAPRRFEREISAVEQSVTGGQEISPGLEVIIVVGDRQRIEIRNGNRGKIQTARNGHARQPRFGSSGQRLEQRGERQVCFTREDVVHQLREGPGVGLAHAAVHTGAAEQDRQVGPAQFEPAREGEAGQDLVEHATEANDVGMTLQNALGITVKGVRDDEVAESLERFGGHHRAAPGLARVVEFEEPVEEPVGLQRATSEQVHREQMLAQREEILGGSEALVGLGPEPGREIELEVFGAAGISGPPRRGDQETDPEAGPGCRGPGHADQ